MPIAALILLWPFATSLAFASVLPGIKGTFNNHHVHHPNGSTISVYIRDSYHVPKLTRRKRFYQMYHVESESSNLCGPSSFVDETATDSALVSDCRAINAAFEKVHGYFETGDYSGGENNFNTLAVAGNCVFGVARRDGQAGRVDVGDTDLINLVNNAIGDFQRDGKVGARGDMECGVVPMRWRIYPRP
ncbi:putative necrosis-inducing factor-domain-containing protein [Pseudomassariella vexata]|uniref:Putative necrosis-inducing factor-domain-containing protein n=1 Tax=Pseudomassariella vexata TaxID=1141098 RepID=A0A1Y2DR20_9PEZI|nr:putative necrosis-inducing factor-domain-containing protein [Pseudomassariella vexata]ORY61711.1 putative necrosis-inducing factor-domain-containing protein [Pseudomassariella vexata]